MKHEEAIILEIIEDLHVFNKSSDLHTIGGIAPFTRYITNKIVMKLYFDGDLTFENGDFRIAFLGLKHLFECPLGGIEQGRYEWGSPHQQCHHFRDARDFYGPLHAVNWMYSDDTFNPERYVEVCKQYGIGTVDERQEFLDKTAIRRRG